MTLAQRTLGQFSVSAIGLGAMPASMGGHEVPPEEQGIQTIVAALEAGITLVDTADIYAPTWDSMGHNERLVARALREWAGDRDSVVVATKGGITRGEGETWGRDGSPEYLRSAVEKSLSNLGVEVIDLYYWHRPDRHRLYADCVQVFKELKDEGKIKEVGISNANVEELDVALDVLGEGGLAAVQNEFSPKFHHTSREELRWCAEHDVAFLPWSPLGGTSGDAKLLDRKYPLIAEAARNHGVSPQQVVLAWELAQGDHLIPIPGASRPASIQDSAQATLLKLTSPELDGLNAFFS